MSCTDRCISTFSIFCAFVLFNVICASCVIYAYSSYRIEFPKLPPASFVEQQSGPLLKRICIQLLLVALVALVVFSLFTFPWIPQNYSNLTLVQIQYQLVSSATRVQGFPRLEENVANGELGEYLLSHLNSLELFPSHKSLPLLLVSYLVYSPKLN